MKEASQATAFHLPILTYEGMMNIVETEIKPFIRSVVEAQFADSQKTPFSDYPEFLTRQQASEVLGVSKPTIDRRVSDKRIKKHNIHGFPRYKKSELLKFKTYTN